MKRKDKRPTLTIGIPAYNEENNISQLVRSIFKQKLTNLVLESVIIVSDGSNDQTVNIIKQFKNKKIRLIVHSSRRGQPYCQNEILKHANSDFLILFEADTLPQGKSVIVNLISAFTSLVNRNPGLIVGSFISPRPKTLTEQILSHGQEIKDYMFKKLNEGNNIYYLGGHSIKAIPKRIYKQIEIPIDVSEDAYWYIKVKSLGKTIIRLPNVKVYSGIVSNFKDGIRQSHKFLRGISSLYKYFPKSVVDKEYKIPTKLILTSLYKYIKKDTIMSLFYLIYFIANRVNNINKTPLKPQYEIYLSSKQVRTQ